MGEHASNDGLPPENGERRALGGSLELGPFDAQRCTTTRAVTNLRTQPMSPRHPAAVIGTTALSIRRVVASNRKGHRVTEAPAHRKAGIEEVGGPKYRAEV